MSTLFVGPSQTNDPDVYRVTANRLAKSADDLVFSPFIGLEREADCLTGEWPGKRLFFNTLLPAMRGAFLELANSDSAIERIHVDLGNELGTLYAAYYALVDARLPVDVTIHRPALGGESMVAKFSPLLVRKLALHVLSRAQNVIVTRKDDAVELWRRYPRIQREFVGDPSNCYDTAQAS